MIVLNYSILLPPQLWMYCITVLVIQSWGGSGLVHYYIAGQTNWFYFVQIKQYRFTPAINNGT